MAEAVTAWLDNVDKATPQSVIFIRAVDERVQLLGGRIRDFEEGGTGPRMVLSAYARATRSPVLVLTRRVWQGGVLVAWRLVVKTLAPLLDSVPRPLLSYAPPTDCPDALEAIAKKDPLGLGSAKQKWNAEELGYLEVPGEVQSLVAMIGGKLGAGRMQASPLWLRAGHPSGTGTAMAHSSTVDCLCDAVCGTALAYRGRLQLCAQYCHSVWPRCRPALGRGTEMA
eukprot:1321869-Rhodomonas_salina.3